ncbi:hypothetical protein BYT27DRAFT_7085925 [Phlegmacium glaucopus]|nr:hypothetical protein BYT27DRAFT_7085925 [Phlegmacium glaucopus]
MTEAILVNDCTTLHHHMAAHHRAQYCQWCKVSNFDSMLPEDTKEHHATLLESLCQTNVTKHFAEAQPEDKPPPYSDKRFLDGCVWLV